MFQKKTQKKSKNTQLTQTGPSDATISHPPWVAAAPMHKGQRLVWHWPRKGSTTCPTLSERTSEHRDFAVCVFASEVGFWRRIANYCPSEKPHALSKSVIVNSHYQNHKKPPKYRQNSPLRTTKIPAKIIKMLQTTIKIAPKVHQKHY